MNGHGECGKKEGNRPEREEVKMMMTTDRPLGAELAAVLDAVAGVVAMQFGAAGVELRGRGGGGELGGGGRGV